MTELTTTTRPTSQSTVGPAPVPVSPAVEAVLITGEQVLFSTAAAVALPPAKTRRWTDMFGSVAGAVRALAAGPQEPARRHHPRRYDYLENALMAREMDRL